MIVSVVLYIAKLLVQRIVGCYCVNLKIYYLETTYFISGGITITGTQACFTTCSAKLP